MLALKLNDARKKYDSWMQQSGCLYYPNYTITPKVTTILTEHLSRTAPTGRSFLDLGTGFSSIVGAMVQVPTYTYDHEMSWWAEVNNFIDEKLPLCYRGWVCPLNNTELIKGILTTKSPAVILIDHGPTLTSRAELFENYVEYIPRDTVVLIDDWGSAQFTERMMDALSFHGFWVQVEPRTINEQHTFYGIRRNLAIARKMR